ncbi:hypothetical protein CEXT_499901 [Caerostris extrusa]|uniref:Uncharacterized protein n=1 Tax=Caerostris extrusa TaxID=172846 RepID=A0AAV4U2X8_CAEEX|nr:hypothetical protein CEXT_499901 [Caerostris extrusa]
MPCKKDANKSVGRLPVPPSRKVGKSLAAHKESDALLCPGVYKKEPCRDNVCLGNSTNGVGLRKQKGSLRSCTNGWAQTAEYGTMMRPP